MADRPEEEKQQHEAKQAPEPKIFVDEDWKTRVQAEKQAAKKGAEKEPPPEDAAAADHAAETAKASAARQGELPAPPASFPLLVTSLTAQAMAALGLTVDAAQGEPQIRLDWAKHFVDMLGVLEEKTKGNLSPQDDALLNNTLHELRMAFVAIKSQQENK